MNGNVRVSKFFNEKNKYTKKEKIIELFPNNENQYSFEIKKANILNINKFMEWTEIFYLENLSSLRHGHMQDPIDILNLSKKYGIKKRVYVYEDDTFVWSISHYYTEGVGFMKTNLTYRDPNHFTGINNITDLSDFKKDILDKYAKIIFNNNDKINVNLLNKIFEYIIICGSVNDYFEHKIEDRPHTFDICASIKYINEVVQEIDKEYFSNVPIKFSNLTEGEKRYFKTTISDFVNFLYSLIIYTIDTRIKNNIFDFTKIDRNSSVIFSIFCYKAIDDKSDEIDNFEEIRYNAFKCAIVYIELFDKDYIEYLDTKCHYDDSLFIKKCLNLLKEGTKNV